MAQHIKENPAEALYGGTKEAVLLHHEAREELARVPWWAGDDAVEEGDPVKVQGRRYRITAWGGRWVGRPAYVFVEPFSSSEGSRARSAEYPSEGPRSATESADLSRQGAGVLTPARPQKRSQG